MLKLMMRDLSILPFSWGAVNITLQRFRPRADGSFDYFPCGMRKPGYCVDSQTRDRILDRARDAHFAQLGLSVLVVILGIVAFFIAISQLPATVGQAEPLFPPAVVWFGVVAVVLTVPLTWLTRRETRRVTKELLRDAAVVQMSEREYRGLVALRWKEMPKGRILWNLSSLFAPFVLYFEGIAERPSGRWLLVAAICLSVVAVLQLAVEAITVWRWSWAGSGGYSDNISRR